MNRSRQGGSLHGEILPKLVDDSTKQISPIHVTADLDPVPATSLCFLNNRLENYKRHDINMVKFILVSCNDLRLKSAPFLTVLRLYDQLND